MRIRVAYSKIGKIRFTGHRDVARMWERAVRKAAIPVAVSTGFTPRLRMAFGLALPTGAESLVELLDLTLADGADIDLDTVAIGLDRALPTGMSISSVEELAAGGPSLQEDVSATTWLMAVDLGNLEEAISRVNDATSLPLERERKGESRTDDVRPGILRLNIAEPAMLAGIPATWLDSVDAPLVEAVLTTSGRGIRPTELVEVLAPGADPLDHLRRVLRINQLIERGGTLFDVIEGRITNEQRLDTPDRQHPDDRRPVDRRPVDRDLAPAAGY